LMILSGNKELWTEGDWPCSALQIYSLTLRWAFSFILNFQNRNSAANSQERLTFVNTIKWQIWFTLQCQVNTVKWLKLK
jgi:hypothetical protein